MIEIVLLAMMQGQTKPLPVPPKVTVCTKAPPRGPSLMLAGKDGNCSKDYTGMKGKDGKVMYCVNAKPAAAPVQCKTAPQPEMRK